MKIQHLPVLQGDPASIQEWLGLDGVHVSSAGHRAAAQSIYRTVEKMLSSSADICTPSPSICVWPNPVDFRSTGLVIVGYDTPAGSIVDLLITDALGRTVMRYAHETKSQGKQYFIWNGTSENGKRISAGSYFVQMFIGPEVKQVRLVIL
jgi:hypothetical protein